jgi:hypothetical protein
LKELGKKNELDVYRMLKAGYHWYEIGQRVGERPNTVYRRFRRLLRRIVGLSERNCGSTEFLADERVPRRKVRSSTERDSTRDTPKLSESGPAGLSERLDSQEPRHESLQHKS